MDGLRYISCHCARLLIGKKNAPRAVWKPLPKRGESCIGARSSESAKEGKREKMDFEVVLAPKCSLVRIM